MTISSFCLFICSNISYVPDVLLETLNGGTQTGRQRQRWSGKRIALGHCNYTNTQSTNSRSYSTFCTESLFCIFFTPCIPPKVIWLPDEEKQMNDKQYGIWYSHVEQYLSLCSTLSLSLSRLFSSPVLLILLLTLNMYNFNVFTTRKHNNHRFYCDAPAMNRT